MAAVAYAVENAAIAFDCAGGGDVVGLTHDQDTVIGQGGCCFGEYLSQRPIGEAAATSRRTHAVADVAMVVIEDVSQRDPA